jgi:hypothetical protein
LGAEVWRKVWLEEEGSSKNKTEKVKQRPITKEQVLIYDIFFHLGNKEKL